MNTAATRVMTTVAMVDSGWRRAFFNRRVKTGIAFVAPKPDERFSDDFDDRIGHGTYCGRLLLRTAPSAMITPVRVFGSRLETSPSVLCSALEWVGSNDFDVVNLSLSTRLHAVRDELYRLSHQMLAAGTRIVAALDNRTGPSYPAEFEGVIAVGLRDSAKGTVPRELTEQADVAIPFGWTFAEGGRCIPICTTSEATAFTSGCIAEMISLGLGQSIEDLQRYVADRFGIAV